MLTYRMANIKVASLARSIFIGDSAFDEWGNQHSRNTKDRARALARASLRRDRRRYWTKVQYRYPHSCSSLSPRGTCLTMCFQTRLMKKQKFCHR
jgi:hypothetical protein